MIQPYAGPRTYALEYSRDEIDRLTREVIRLTSELAKNQPALPVGPIIRANGVALKFGELSRVLPPAAGLIVVLPDASPTDSGAGLEVAVLSAAGAVTYQGRAATVNGASPFTAPAEYGLRHFRWDGQQWVTEA